MLKAGSDALERLRQGGEESAAAAAAAAAHASDYAAAAAAAAAGRYREKREMMCQTSERASERAGYNFSC